MPDVGVLQLEIRDNSTEAGQGLGLLASALSKVQKAIGSGINFDSIAKGVSELKTSAQGSEKAITSISSLFNALANFGRVKDIRLDKIASAFAEIKATVGSGFNIGNAGYNLNQMRLAFTGDWGNTADAEGKINSAISGMSAIKAAGEEFKSADTAGTIRDVANAISELSNSTGTIGSGGAHDLYQMLGASSADGFRDLGYNSALGMEDGIQKGTARVAQAAEDMTYAAMDSVAETQDSNSPSREFMKLGEYAGEGYAEGIKNKIADAIKIASEFTTSIIASAKDNAPAAAKQAAEFTQGIVTGVLGNVNLPETQQAVIGQALTVASDFTKSIVENSKGNIEQAAKVAGDFTQSILSKTIGDALSNGMNGNELKSDITETGKGFEEAEKVFKNVGETIEGTKNSIEDMSGSLSNAKTVVGATLKEFENLEKNKSFRSYMYGPRNDISISGMGFQPGYETDEERMAKNPQWYNPEEFYERIASAATKAKDPVSDLNETIEQSQKAPTTNPDVSYIDNLIKNSSDIDLLNMRLESMTNRLYEGATSGQMTGEQIANMVSQIQALKKEVAGLSGSTFNLGLSFKGLKTGIEKMFPTLSQMVKRLGTIAKYRFIRSIIKHITSGFNEGLKNMYEYSKLVGGTFAPAMDSAASAIATMKNSLGAALAPAVQAVIPYVTQLVNWFIQGVNWANQLFALLGGQNTWTRALPATVNAFDKQKKAAKGAGAAIKDLLADWDELNIIQSESGSGGGSAQAAEDYLKMFEEVGRFDNTIRKISDFVQDHLGDITSMIKDAGLALLAWKFSKAFTGPLAMVAGLAAAGKTLEITWKLTEMFDNEYLKYGEPGWIIGDVLANLVGNYFAGTIIQTVLGGGSGLITFGFGMEVSAGITYGIALTDESSDRSDMLKQIAAIKGLIGFAATAAGFGIATGSAGVGLGLAAMFGIPMFTLTAAVSTVITQLKNAKQIAEEAFTKKHVGAITVDELYKELNDEFKKQSAGYSITIDAMANVPDLKVSLEDATTAILGFSAVVTGGDALTQEEAEKFKQAWQTVFSAFEGITKSSFDAVFSALNQSLASENEEIRKQAKELRISLIMLEQNTTQGVAEVQAEMEAIADKIASGTASSDEMEKYQAYLEALAKATNKSFTTLEETVENGTKVDFDSAKEVEEFFDTVNAEAKDTIDEINAGVESAVAGIDEVRTLTEFRKTVTEMGDEEYNAAMTLLDNTQENITAEAERRKASVEKSVQDAYNLILQSALKGLNDIPLTGEGERNYLAGASYLIEKVLPIADEIKKRGGKIDEELGKALGESLSSKDIIDEALKVLGSGNLHDSPLFRYLMDVWGDEETKNREAPKSTDFLDNAIESVEKFEEAYGNKLKETGEKIEKHVEEFKDTLSDLSYQAPTEETPRVELPEYYNPMGWLDFFGISYQPPETPVDIPVTVNVEPIIDSDELYRQIREKILNSDMPDTSVPLEQTFDLWQNDEQEVLQELRNRIDKFGIDQAFDMLTNFLNGQDWTLGKVPDVTRANVPNYTPQTNGSFLNGNETLKTEPADPARDVANVETGVRNGNKNLEGLIRDLIATTDRVANRPINVSMFPSSNWGFWGRNNEKRAEAVTGG